MRDDPNDRDDEDDGGDNGDGGLTGDANDDGRDDLLYDLREGDYSDGTTFDER
jgi:hypothetical protein